MGAGAPEGPAAGSPSVDAPARRRLTMEELDPAGPVAVPVVSFDAALDEPAPAAAVVSADFDGGFPVGETAREPRPAGPEDPPDDHPSARVGATSSTGAGVADLDELGPAAGREPPAELGRLDEPAEDGPRLTMDDLRFGSRTSRTPARGGGERRPAGERPTAGRGERAGARRSDRTSAADGPVSIGADPERTPRAGRDGRSRSRGAFGASRDTRESGATGDSAPGAREKSPEEQEAAAKEICLRLLTDRARTKHELGARMRQKGVPDEVAETVLARFDEVGLIDDEAFASAWVRSRHRGRGLGRKAIAQELRRKGVAKEVADEALTEVDDEAEAQRARELVDRKLRTMRIAGPEDRQKAGRRLIGMLARKGYPGSIVYPVVRTALAEHGADEDELGSADFG